nr:TBC domain-containing protein kinase-like protein isoform X1 [Parasteatoda tepidariorum]
MMDLKSDATLLGAWTFFASAHAIDVCGINGLPLTPNSIRILGRFQKLKLLIHDRLSLYLDAQRGKHERVMVVSEHYQNGLHNKKKKFSVDSCKDIALLSFEILDGLSYLHSQGMVHRYLSPNNIRFDCEGHVKLSNYGLYYMTENGSTVSFPIGSPNYMAPEVLAHGLFPYPSSPKCDIWSLGIILLELILENSLFEGLTLDELLKEIILFTKLENGSEVIDRVLKKHDCSSRLEAASPNLKSFIADCLTPNPSQRPDAQQLLQHSFFNEFDFKYVRRRMNAPLSFLSTQMRCNGVKDKKQILSYLDDHLCQRPLHEVYYLWRLAGGDLESELRRQELIRAKPPVLNVSKIISGEGEEFGHEKDQAFLLDDSILILPLEPLKHRLRDVDNDIYYPLTEYSLNGITLASCLSTLKETSKLPIIIKEKDVEYQLHRIVLFKKLLEGYPYKRTQMLQEAKIDVPPLYRPWIWATLLDIEGDIQSIYDSIDKETPTPTDRQIEVDIPRCHQYDELLSSPAGHLKFKRILKAWVVSHPQYVYWQGLDSLCAPFLALNFNNEALAYACFASFIPKYLYNFFLKDNSAVIQEYLAKFSHLIAFHDPELTNHLDSIAFIPELYAIPWFLTMYTHVFPLHKIFHLWDTLLLGHASFPLCIGVAILKQLKNNLLSYSFNDCILMFSDMPEIDIQRCVQDSIKVFCSTPKSITYRMHESPNPKQKKRFESNTKFSKADSVADSGLTMKPIPLHELISETCPRISAEDLLDLLDILPDSKTRARSQSIKLLVIDIRPNDEYSKGALPNSINIPFSSAFTSDGIVDSPIIRSYKGKIITVVSSNTNKLASEFATKLVRQGYSHVCTLHGGIEVLQKTGFLTTCNTES